MVSQPAQHDGQQLPEYQPPVVVVRLPGDKVAIVEDTVTRGTSIFEAVEAVRTFGAHPVFITVIVDRGGTCAELARAANIAYQPMLTAPELGYDYNT